MTAAEVLRQKARELLVLADELDGRAPSAPIPAAPPEPNDWVDSNTARKVAGVERSTIYRWARRYNIGVQSATGQWRISRRALLAIAAVSRRGELGDDGYAARVSMATRGPQNVLPLFSTPEPPDE